MAEQLFHRTTRANEPVDVGTHLTWFRKHQDERTGHQMLSINGEPYNKPPNSHSPSALQPSLQAGIPAYQQHSCTGTLLPIFPATVHNDTGTQNAGEEFLQCAPIWAATQLNQTGITTIGRDPSSNLSINDLTVSRRHAQIACIHQRYLLHDLGSKNGTFVNDVPLEPGTVWVLNPNDRIRFGKGLTFIFQVQPAGSLRNQEPNTTMPWR